LAVTNGPIENKAKWLDEGCVAELAKRIPSSKMSEAIAIEVIDHAPSFPC